MKLQMDWRRLTAIGFLAIASGLVGCATFQEQASPKLTAELTTGAGRSAAPPAKYTVEIRPEKGKPQAVEKELTDETHVQTALEQSGAAKKYARMQVELYRPLKSGVWHKMSLEFDRDEHRVPPEYDYSLLPGDRIIVTEDPTNVLDDIMQYALRPLGFKPPSKKDKVKEKYEIRG